MTTSTDVTSTTENTSTAAATSPTTVSSTTTLDTTSTNDPATSMSYTKSSITPKDHVQPAVIGGAVGGAVVVIIIIVIIVCILIRKRRRDKQKGPPPMLPDPNMMISTDPIGRAVSTTILVRNDSLDQTTGTSADTLPIAPPVPLDYEATGPYLEELYVNQEMEEDPSDTAEDYIEPTKWDEYTETKQWGEDTYIPMGTSVLPHVGGDQQMPVPSSALVAECDDPSSQKSKPVACVGSSSTKGYVNVPDDKKNVGTLPKYANMEKSPTKGMKEGEEDDQEDYENVTKATGSKDSTYNARSKMADLMVNNAQRHTSPRNQSSPKPQHNPKVKSATAPKSTPGSTPSSTPKIKQKVLSKSTANGEGAADYVNIQKYSKKPHQKADTEFVGHFSKR